MLISLIYVIVRRLFAVLVVMMRSDASKDAGLLVLRHENAVLRRQMPRLRYEPADRVWLAALSRLVSVSCPFLGLSRIHPPFHSRPPLVGYRLGPPRGRVELHSCRGPQPASTGDAQSILRQPPKSSGIANARNVIARHAVQVSQTVPLRHSKAGARAPWELQLRGGLAGRRRDQEDLENAGTVDSFHSPELDV